MKKVPYSWLKQRVHELERKEKEKDRHHEKMEEYQKLKQRYWELRHPGTAKFKKKAAGFASGMASGLRNYAAQEAKKKPKKAHKKKGKSSAPYNPFGFNIMGGDYPVIDTRFM